MGFEWVEDTSKFRTYFIKSYNEDSNIGYFFDDYVKYSEQLHKFLTNLLFLQERMRVNRYDEWCVYYLNETKN